MELYGLRFRTSTLFELKFTSSVCWKPIKESPRIVRLNNRKSIITRFFFFCLSAPQLTSAWTEPEPWTCWEPCPVTTTCLDTAWDTVRIRTSGKTVAPPSSTCATAAVRRDYCNRSRSAECAAHAHASATIHSTLGCSLQFTRVPVPPASQPVRPPARTNRQVLR